MNNGKPSIQKNSLHKFKTIDKKSRETWEKGISQFNEELSQGASDYVSKQRIRSAKIAELSRIRMLG